MSEVHRPGEDRSLGELFSSLSTDMSDLVRKEIQLAKVELKQEAKDAGKAGGMLGAAGVSGYLAILLLSFAAAWGLSEIVPEGVAFLIVGLVWAVVAAVLASTGRKKLQEVEPPRQTMDSLKEDAEWAKNLRS